ncbi:MAG: hypothetical protein FJ138_11380, partial [Deltaproteobacteria bacterium]|nr:hypothetical protein [Deltaproteobacteria bacterium]
AGEPQGGAPAAGEPQGGAPAAGEPQGGAPAAGEPQGGAPAEDPAVARAYEWLTGSFDSSAQAAADPSYFAIQLKVCPIRAPELGARALYVEQASLDTPTRPYRQRLYVVSGAGEGAARSAVYELAAPDAWVGACDEPAPRAAAPADASYKDGCDVLLTWDEGRGALVGGTQGTGCNSSLSGATYATSEVTLTATELLSWDRGFNDLNVQVWGATEGAYRFVRRP